MENIYQMINEINQVVKKYGFVRLEKLGVRYNKFEHGKGEGIIEINPQTILSNQD